MAAAVAADAARTQDTYPQRPHTRASIAEGVGVVGLCIRRRGLAVSREMLTLFTAPKPFVGQAKVHQTNALRSWLRLRPRPEILVFGDEPGIAEACADLGVHHQSVVEKSELGTPLLNGVFREAHRASPERAVMVYVNADIILLDDFVSTVELVRAWSDRFLVLGRRRDIDASEELRFDEVGLDALRALVRREGELRDGWWIDYFVFPKGLWEEIPPFAVGRPAWDNWMVFDAVRRRIPVVDATQSIMAIHQRHGYAHVPENRGDFWQGPEGDRNKALAGGLDAAYSLDDATHVVRSGGVQRRLTAQPLRRLLERWERRPGVVGSLAHASRRLGRSVWPRGTKADSDGLHRGGA
jgi:hypothetical protein